MIAIEHPDQVIAQGCRFSRRARLVRAGLRARFRNRQVRIINRVARPKPGFGNVEFKRPEIAPLGTVNRRPIGHVALSRAGDFADAI